MLLTTRRLILREFTEDDWRAVLEYQSDPAYLRYNPYSYRHELDVRSFVHMFIEWSMEVPRKKYQFAIVLKDEGRLIGNCGLRMQTTHAQVADLGYEISRPYWGQGYATEAARTLLAFGFNQLHLHRIWAYCIAENTASARVLEKIGMTYEGCQRQSEHMKNRWWDTLHYAILEHEWRSLTSQDRQQSMQLDPVRFPHWR
jgi:[ribosomal protein S5]-alanine N-acetyltransferase